MLQAPGQMWLIPYLMVLVSFLASLLACLLSSSSSTKIASTSKTRHHHNVNDNTKRTPPINNVSSRKHKECGRCKSNWPNLRNWDFPREKWYFSQHRKIGNHGERGGIRHGGTIDGVLCFLSDLWKALWKVGFHWITLHFKTSLNNN